MFSSYIEEQNNNFKKDIKELNKLILKFVDNVNTENNNNIIGFLQTNNYDSNNSLIDNIINENDEEKKNKLIKEYKNKSKIDYDSSGYVLELFKIFNNVKEFCLIEKKIDNCVLCKKHTKI